MYKYCYSNEGAIYAKGLCMMWLLSLRAQQGCAETISANALKLLW